MPKLLALALLAVGFPCVISMDMDSALAADAECGPGEECALNALQQKAVVAQLQSEDSVEKFAAALEEGDADAEAEAQSLAQQASDEKWVPYTQPTIVQPVYTVPAPYYSNQYGPPAYGPQYVNSYPPTGFNPSYSGHYGVGGCMTKIQGSSCMVFDCARSRGPTRCNLQDYFCYCQPGYCSDGMGCVMGGQQPMYR